MAEELIARLSTLPPGVLYLVAGVVAAFENVFPPFPSDMVVALTVFISARIGAPLWPGALATWVGSVAGAMFMYAVGRRYGAQLMMKKLERYVGADAEDRLQALHNRYGMTALFLSRFLPGVRALVPPFAGAMRIRTLPVTLAIALASGIWYGFIAYIAYETGENWKVLLQHLKRSTSIFTAVAVVVALVWLLVWYIRRRRHAKQNAQQQQQQQQHTPPREG